MKRDAKFVVTDDGRFVCEECGQLIEDHDSRVEVDGPMKGWTRHSCRTSDVDA